MPTQDTIRLKQDDLYSTRVEGFLEAQAALNRGLPDAVPQPLLTRVIYSSYFYLSIASLVGALCGWGILEPFFDDRDAETEKLNVVEILLFPMVGGFVGLFLGGAEGLMCRNFKRALICSATGLGIGFAGGLVAMVPAGIIFGIMINVAVAMTPAGGHSAMPRGFALLVLIMGRAAAWAVVALPAGMGQGIALREKKVILNGIIGGVLGGLLGGMLFDPIYLLINNPDNASVSRGVGFAMIGLMVGLFVGLVEQWTKSAWLLMKAGPLSGKQFVLYRSPTVIGSSPKAEIYLFKDEAIEPKHALIHNRGGRFEIEDCGTPDGTYVNGIPIKKHMLQAGDQIVLGKTVLEFALKESK